MRHFRSKHILSGTCLYCFCFSFPMEDHLEMFYVRNFSYLTLALFLLNKSTHFDNHKQNFERTKFTLLSSVYSRELYHYYFLFMFLFSVSLWPKKERRLRPKVCQKSECLFLIHLDQN